MSQLNIHELYESSRRKELKKFETFDKILQRCHNKIKLYAQNRKTECIYEVPGFIIGVPIYDIEELKEYLISSLKKNGFILKQFPPNWIYISWDIKNKKVLPKILKFSAPVQKRSTFSKFLLTLVHFQSKYQVWG